MHDVNTGITVTTTLPAPDSDKLEAVVNAQSERNGDIIADIASNNSNDDCRARNTSAVLSVQRRNRHIERYLFNDFIVRDVCSYMSYSD